MTSPLSVRRPAPRVAAFAIAASALLIMVALFHHPVIGRHENARDAHVQLVQLGFVDNLVHGVLTATLVVLASALAVFGDALGPRRPATSGALFAYCLGCVLLGVAMLFDGFVVPGLAAQFVSAPPFETQVGMLIVRAIGVTIQVFSKAGLIAQCLAILAWSYVAATGGAARAGLRWFAAIGVPAALLPAALILFTDLQLTPHSLMGILAAHAAWYLAAAWLLYTGRG